MSIRPSGNRSREASREARRWRAGPALLAAAALAVGGGGARTLAAQAATVSGSLVNRDTHGPVEGARVTIIGTALGASSDAEGRFQFTGVPAGVRVMQVRAIGYVVSSWVVQLSEGQVLHQTFELDGSAPALDTITVAAEPSSNWRSEGGFERRRRAGVGYFITRGDIQRRRAATIADLMRIVPGVITSCNYRGCTVLMAQSQRPCPPEYYLDGYPATFATGPSFDVHQIRGVEVYRSRFDVPPEFQRPNLLCGVIAIWTVEPGTRLENH